MLLNLKDLIATPGQTLDINCAIDLSALDFFGERPIKRPARVTGAITNRAGLLRLTATAEVIIDTLCASCGQPVSAVRVFDIGGLLTDDEDAENDELIIMRGEALDLAETVSEAVVLNMAMRILCREDCKGACYKCGHDLNKGLCGCKKEIDPRWAKLKSFSGE